MNAKRKTYLDTKGHFNQMAQQYDKGSEKVEWRGPQALFSALKILYGTDEKSRAYKKLNKPLQILDLGTGTGMIGALFKHEDHFKKKGAHVTGVDIASEMLKVAKKKGRINQAIEGSVTDLSWSGDEHFDVVTSSGVLDFVDDPEAFIAEATRVAKPGAFIALTFEPAGTSSPGYQTLQHDIGELKALFSKHNAPKIILEGSLPVAYHGFAGDSKGRPVENHILVAYKAINLSL